MARTKENTDFQVLKIVLNVACWHETHTRSFLLPPVPQGSGHTKLIPKTPFLTGFCIGSTNGKRSSELRRHKKVEVISPSGGSPNRDVGSGILPSVSGDSAMSPPCQRMQDPGIWRMTLSPFYAFSSGSSNGFLKLSIFFFFFLKSNQHL